MAALDFLQAHRLNADIEQGRLAVWPKANITAEVRQWIVAHKDQLLTELRSRRRAWRVIRDGKAIATMVGPPMRPEEALEAAKARWSDASVET